MIKEQMLLTFETEEQQRAFHARLKAVGDDQQEWVRRLVAAEREACAKIADRYQDDARDSEFDTGVLSARAGIASAIRARSTENGGET